MTLTYGEVCAGVKGIGLGLDRAGMKPIWAIEKDPACRRVISRHWPEVEQFEDVTETPSESLRRVDLVAGGTPCTDLSNAGRRAGLAGEKSRLFFEFTRILAELAPTWCLFENVPGLLSSNKGRDFAAVLGHLTGYFPEVPDDGWRNSGVCTGPAYNVAWSVLDAQWFGVPQRRKRVFVVGHLGDATRAVQVLLEPESLSGNPPPSREAQETIAGTLGGGTPGRGWSDDTDRMTFVPIGFAWQAGGNNSASGAFINDGVPTLNVSQTMAVAVAENQRGEVITSEVAQSLTSGGGKPGQGYAAAFDGVAVRRLTPLECERLQGWPDDHTAGESDSARYRMAGNGVCANVAEWIGRRIVEVGV